jgi:hypothetical protein
MFRISTKSVSVLSCVLFTIRLFESYCHKHLNSFQPKSGNDALPLGLALALCDNDCQSILPKGFRTNERQEEPNCSDFYRMFLPDDGRVRTASDA